MAVAPNKIASRPNAVQPSASPSSSVSVQALSGEDKALLSRLLREPTEYMDHPTLHKRGAEKELFGTEAAFLTARANFFPLPTVTGEREPRGDKMPALTAAEERHLFLRYNFARKQIVDILREFAGRRLTAAATHRLVFWGRRALQCRSEIVRLNLPLVLAMAKRTRLNNIDFSELISEGNMALLRSVEKFDCSRGFKFSTYSCRAILKSFSRVAMRASRYRGRFPTEFDPSIEKSDYVERKREDVEIDCVDELKAILIRNLADLNDIERTVINERFALNAPDPSATSPKTLEEVGQIIGVTKERVRQIQNKALEKIRHALEENYLAA
ncbi:MAG TPA: sigma-70 family RNA polymerase sigma factor [Phycisphaerae bacterium]|jgi:RNA polymerase sigma factor (sigma-70 family)